MKQFAAAALMLIAMTGIASADWITATVATGNEPLAVAVNPVTNKTYVTNSFGGSVTVIDGVTNDTTLVDAGTNPWAVAVNSVTNKIYVANHNSANVIDGATNETTLVPADSNPYAVAVNPVTNRIYVANYAESRTSGDVTVIDGATNNTTLVAADSAPWAVAVNPVTNKIYVPNYGSDNVTVIDGATNETTLVAAGAGPRYVAVNPVTNEIYVSNSDGDDVTVINGATNSTTLVPVGTCPGAVAVNPVTNKIYVTNADNNVAVIDGATKGTTPVAAGAGSIFVAVNPVANKIYVANYFDSSVTVIDGATNSTIQVAADSWPFAVAVNPVTNKIYVANQGSANVTVITDAPANDTEVCAAFDRLPGDTTVLARPVLTGKGVNRSTPGRTTMMGACNRLNTTQTAWDWANVTSGAGTDSITWTYAWGTDSLIAGENFVYAQPLESDAGITNNQGLGTPFAGNLDVYPIYRIPVHGGVAEGRRESDVGVPTLSVFPNPCPGKARITYSLSRPGDLSLKLYDVAGKLNATLASGPARAGTSHLELRPSRLACGVYLLRLETGKTTLTRKLIIE